jgi:hypothetical protein
VNLDIERDKYPMVSLLQLIRARTQGNTLIIFILTHISQAGLTHGDARQRRACFLVVFYTCFFAVMNCGRQMRINGSHFSAIRVCLTGFFFVGHKWEAEWALAGCAQGAQLWAIAWPIQF